MSTIDALILVATALSCDPETLTADSQLGGHPKWDSFGHLNVMMALEQSFGVEINDETIRRFSRFSEIVALSGSKPDA
jgi:acyl carrier protein